MRSLRNVWSVAMYNFRGWLKNPRIYITFGLAFVLCFLLSNKAVKFAEEYGTIMQIVEAFVWTFGDANSIMLVSLLLALLFADMPFLGAGVPFYLMRISRIKWLLGQMLYIVLATTLFMVFILVATSVVCMSNSFVGNMWSETAARLGYSEAGKAIALPAMIKTMEMSTPYMCMMHIFALMLSYTLLMVFMMLFVTIKRGQFWGVSSIFVFSLFGFLLNPEFIKNVMKLPDQLMYKANVAVGWISPLNQATYHMHNFGYDLLPRLWMTYAIFGGLILVCFFLSFIAIKKYSFNFIGTD